VLQKAIVMYAQQYTAEMYRVKELQNNGEECSNIREEITTMEREVVSRLSVLSDGTDETE
jgi:hypothetical protein